MKKTIATLSGADKYFARLLWKMADTTKYFLKHTSSNTQIKSYQISSLKARYCCSGHNSNIISLPEHNIEHNMRFLRE